MNIVHHILKQRKMCAYENSINICPSHHCLCTCPLQNVALFTAPSLWSVHASFPWNLAFQNSPL
jgi:hypothetical protein